MNESNEITNQQKKEEEKNKLYKVKKRFITESLFLSEHILLFFNWLKSSIKLDVTANKKFI